MAALPKVREILESVVGKTSELKSLLKEVNSFIRDTVTALDSNLTVAENLAQCWLEVRITEGQLPNPITLPLLKGRAPFGLTVEAVSVLSGSISGPVWVDWEPRGTNAIKLRAVYGLSTGAVVNLRLLVKAE